MHSCKQAAGERVSRRGPRWVRRFVVAWLESGMVSPLYLHAGMRLARLQVVGRDEEKVIQSHQLHWPSSIHCRCSPPPPFPPPFFLSPPGASTTAAATHTAQRAPFSQSLFASNELPPGTPKTEQQITIPAMAARCALSAPSCLVRQPLCGDKLGKKLTPCLASPRAVRLRVNAAKLPAGVEVPRVQPKLSEPFLGFTQTAEIWNSRACMIGLIGTFIVELVLNKGILQIIGVEVGKGLDLPL